MPARNGASLLRKPLEQRRFAQIEPPRRSPDRPASGRLPGRRRRGIKSSTRALTARTDAPSRINVRASASASEATPKYFFWRSVMPPTIPDARQVGKVAVRIEPAGGDERLVRARLNARIAAGTARAVKARASVYDGQRREIVGHILAAAPEGLLRVEAKEIRLRIAPGRDFCKGEAEALLVLAAGARHALDLRLGLYAAQR